MKDITRFLIIIVAINLLMGGIQVYSATTTSETIDEQALQQLAENVRSTVETEVGDDSTRPENYEGQQSFGSEENLGLQTIVQLMLTGLDPFPEVAEGHRTTVSRDLMRMIGYIRMFIHLMTGILLYLVIKNKMT